MRTRTGYSLVALCALALTAWSALGADYLWWEAENAEETNFPDRGGLDPRNEQERAALSGGKWLTAPGKRFGPPLFARYRVEVPSEKTYSLWVRKLWKHGPFRWRFEGQDWRVCDRNCSLADSAPFRPSIPLNWVPLGQVDLTKGEHLFAFETTGAVLEPPSLPPAKPIVQETVTMKAADWCTVTLPKQVAVGQEIPLTVAYRDVPAGMKLFCQMHWKKSGGTYAGWMKGVGEGGEISGNGQVEVKIEIENMGPELVEVFPVLFVGPEGSWKKRVKEARADAVPVDPESVGELPIEGASIIGLDCFLLIDKPFVPRGLLRPGEKLGRHEEGWFGFEPDTDEFGDGALLDLSFLNEKEAGSQGFVKARGGELVFEKTGATIKFWGPAWGPSGAHLMDNGSLDYLAARLAKAGVNLCRIHANNIMDRNAEDPRTVDARILDRIHYTVSAMKKHGIYTALCLYYPLTHKVTKSWNLPGYEGRQPNHALFFQPRMQEIYKAWTEKALTAPNPYTGKPLTDEPALAALIINNEDNLFWFSAVPYRGIPEGSIEVLEKAFGDWLQDRYGSLEAAAEAWGDQEGKAPRGDSFSQGRVGLYAPSMLPAGRQPKEGRNEQRACDQARFMTELLRTFYADTTRWLKEDLGFKSLVIATNWKTADEFVLGPLDKYAYMAGDALARNAYFSPLSKKKVPWAVNVGDHYNNRCALLEPDKQPVMAIQHSGYPNFHWELNWGGPNRFRADYPLLCAAYGSLQGTDGFFHFTIESANWLNRIDNPFPIYTPVGLGQFPATALIFRKGYVQEGPTVIDEALRLDDLYQLKGASISQTMSLDDFRAADVTGKTDTKKADMLDPRSFLVGKVMRTISADPGETSVMDLSEYIDESAGMVRSATGELTWDYGSGLVTVNTPCAQGATGFLEKAGRVELGDIAVQSGNEYGTVLVVSLDGKPLRESGRILLQVMTEEKNYGWSTQPSRAKLVKWPRTAPPVDCLEITGLGEGPVQVRRFDGTVTLRRPDADVLKVHAVDVNGYPIRQLPAGEDGLLTVSLLPDCLYYIIGD